jgi:4-amino-4-deoxy-L-arabinose transferase-like glycosyltransferase
LFLFGQGYDQASLVNLLYSAIIILSIYHLGKYLFENRKIAITTSILWLVSPILGIVRTDYLLDYALRAIVISIFSILIIWRNSYTSFIS